MCSSSPRPRRAARSTSIPHRPAARSSDGRRTNTAGLQITSDEPCIPWELIKPYDDSDPDDVVDDDFLGQRFQLTRWLANAPAPPRHIEVRRLACFAVTETVKGQPPLPNAARERELLASLAEGGVVDASPARATFEELEALLQRGDAGLFHFAAHGEPVLDRPDEAAVRLVDGVFRPRHLCGPLRAGIRRRRPLVFFNVCWSSQPSWSLTGLGGWVDSWVRDSRCGAFVAPQWSVRDDLAYIFAETFYRQLRAGRTIGKASWEARREVRRREPGDPTWLAYIVYAHPGARLVLDTSHGDELPAQSSSSRPLG